MPVRIVVIGSVNTDMVVRGPHIPSPGETVTGGTFLRADGGKGANQAVAAARAGAGVTFVGRVGADDLGRSAVAGLAAEGIDVGFVGRDPDHATGVALIMVDEEGENAISVAPGANARLSVEDVEAARAAIESADVLLTQLEIPVAAVERAAEIASAAGVTVMLDPAPARETAEPRSDHRRGDAGRGRSPGRQRGPGGVGGRISGVCRRYDSGRRRVQRSSRGFDRGGTRPASSGATSLRRGSPGGDRGGGQAGAPLSRFSRSAPRSGPLTPRERRRPWSGQSCRKPSS